MPVDILVAPNTLKNAKTNKKRYQTWAPITYQRQGYSDNRQNPEIHADMNKNLTNQNNRKAAGKKPREIWFCKNGYLHNSPKKN